MRKRLVFVRHPRHSPGFCSARDVFRSCASDKRTGLLFFSFLVRRAKAQSTADWLRRRSIDLRLFFCNKTFVPQSVPLIEDELGTRLP